MSAFVVLLISISCFMHAGWNLIARHQREEAAFFKRILVIILVIGFVPALISEVLTQSISQKAWLFLLGSGVCCGLYYYFLALAYESSDFSVAYPVARALPVILVGLADILRARYPTAIGWVGMLIVVVGCIMTPMDSLRRINIKQHLTKASIWMGLTALGTVGYTMFDKMAAETVARGPATAARYGYMFFAISGIVYCILLRLIRPHKLNTSRVKLWQAGLGALFNFGAYWLVLWAYQLTARASYIVAFRQFSIAIGVVLALIIYKEKNAVVRLTATGLIVAGLVIIGLWG
jgi:uncharacterized membrane protein